MDEMRTLLDSLMGKDRNAPVTEQKRKITFRDQEVCKNYLLDFCPHDLFPNTKSDLGTCPNLHSDALREEFLAEPQKNKFAEKYEVDFTDFLRRMVEQVELKIRKGNERIEAPLPSERLLKPEDLSLERKEKISQLQKQISGLLMKADEAGQNNDVEEAENLSRQVASLRRQVERLQTNATPYEVYVHREKQLRVCEVCGAMQSIGDSMSRFESHITGKQHLGYERIRQTLVLMSDKQSARRREIDSAKSLEKKISESEIKKIPPVAEDSSAASGANAITTNGTADFRSVDLGHRRHRSFDHHRRATRRSRSRSLDRRDLSPRRESHSRRYSRRYESPPTRPNRHRKKSSRSSSRRRRCSSDRVERRARGEESVSSRLPPATRDDSSNEEGELCD